MWVSQNRSVRTAMQSKPNRICDGCTLSGTPGLSEAGDLPKDISGQAELAWQHILKMLRQAHMAPTDLVKVTQYLTRAEDIPAYAKVRSRMLGDVRPAFMLLVVPHSFDQSFLLRLKQLRRAANLRLDLFEGARPRPDIPISSAPQYWDEGENPVFPWRVECVNNIDHLRMLLRISQRRPLSGRELRSRPAQRYVASMTLMVPSVRSSVEFAFVAVTRVPRRDGRPYVILRGPRWRSCEQTQEILEE